MARAVAAAGGAVLALTFLAVAASDPPSGFVDIGDAGWVADIMIGTVAVAAVVSVVVVPAMIVLSASGPKVAARQLQTTRSWLVRMITPPLLLVGAVLVIRWMRDSGTTVPFAETLFGPPKGTLEGEGGSRSGTRQTNWGVVMLTIAGLGVAIGAAFAAARRRVAAIVEEGPSFVHAVELAEAAQASLDALDAEPDHRLAVIAAYARMEHLFAEAGLPREPAETAREHVDRALGYLGAPPEVVRVLADRFEEARFSLRPIGPDARQAAVEALTRLRDELRPAEPDPAFAGVTEVSFGSPAGEESSPGAGAEA